MQREIQIVRKHCGGMLFTGLRLRASTCNTLHPAFEIPSGSVNQIGLHALIDYLKYLCNCSSHLGVLMKFNYLLLALFISSQVYAQVNETPINKAKASSAATIGKKPKINNKTTALPPPSSDSIAFFKASESLNYEIMSLYLSKGADINCRNCSSSGATPLLSKLKDGSDPNFNFVKYMVEHGADVNLGDSFGTTPLMITAQRAMFDYGKVGSAALTIELLLNAGAKLEATDDEGKTAINYFRGFSDSFHSVSLLLKANANINHQDKSGMTLLMKAVSSCGEAKPEFIEFLLRSNADASLKNTQGNRALDLALSVATQNRNCNAAVRILNNI